MNRLNAFGGDRADEAKAAEMERRKWADRENEIRLHLLQSLAMSQRAISRMIRHCADLSGDSEELSRHIMRNLDLIVRCQGALAEKISGHRLRVPVRGTPGRPWLNRRLVSSVQPARQQTGMGQPAAETVQ